MTVRYIKGESDARPWGAWEVLDTGDRHAVKKISVQPGQQISLQVHQQRDEHWLVVAGKGEVTLDDKVHPAAVSDHIQISAGQKHRITNNGRNALVLIEVQLGDDLSESDITRLDDSYGR